MSLKSFQQKGRKFWNWFFVRVLFFNPLPRRA